MPYLMLQSKIGFGEEAGLFGPRQVRLQHGASVQIQTIRAHLSAYELVLFVLVRHVISFLEG